MIPSRMSLLLQWLVLGRWWLVSHVGPGDELS